MISSGYRPGSFDDARLFGWQSMFELVGRWWPIYAAGLIATSAVSLLGVDPMLRGLAAIVLVTTPSLVTCATQFRGRFAITPALVSGIALTAIIPSLAVQLLVKAPLLLPWSTRSFATLLALVLTVWLGPKLIGSACFYLLGAGALTPSECFALSWRWVAGENWINQFLVALVGVLIAIPVALLAGFPSFALHLGPLTIVIGFVLGMLLNLYYFSALMRIVSISPQLWKTYWEASENTAQ